MITVITQGLCLHRNVVQSGSFSQTWQQNTETLEWRVICSPWSWKEIKWRIWVLMSSIIPDTSRVHVCPAVWSLWVIKTAESLKGNSAKTHFSFLFFNLMGFSFLAFKKKVQLYITIKIFWYSNSKVTALTSSAQPATQRCHRWLYFYFPSLLLLSTTERNRTTFLENYQYFSQSQWNFPLRLFSIPNASFREDFSPCLSAKQLLSFCYLPCKGGWGIFCSLNSAVSESWWDSSCNVFQMWVKP